MLTLLRNLVLAPLDENPQVATEAYELASMVWYYHPDTEGDIAGARYAAALLNPHAETGRNFLIDKAVGRRNSAQQR